VLPVLSLNIGLKILDIIIMSSESSTSEMQSPNVPIKVKAPKVSLPKKVVEKVVEENNVVETITSKLKDTNNIKYIVIAVILLGAVVYYVYTTKYKKDTNVEAQPKQPLRLPVPKQNPSDIEVQALRRQLLQKQEESNQLLREREQLVAEVEHQRRREFDRQNEQQQRMNSQSIESLDLNLNMDDVQPKRKLKHPNDNNEKIEEIQASESPLVAQHNLTQAEMDEISSKLSKLQ